MFFGIVVFNVFFPEIFMELKPDEVEILSLNKLQALFDMPRDLINDDDDNDADDNDGNNDGDDTLRENGKYIYAGATVEELKLKHVDKCLYEGRVLFNLDGQEYFRPISISYTRKTIGELPQWSFDLTYGDYTNTPDELREDVVIAFRDWFQRRNKGLDNWKIEDIRIISSEHPKYTFHLKCVRTGNKGKKHFAETELSLTFNTISNGRYHPVMHFHNTDHEMLHSYFIYRWLGVKMKDGAVIKECRLKKCTGTVDTFVVKYSNNVVLNLNVTFGDNFSWKILK